MNKNSLAGKANAKTFWRRKKKGKVNCNNKDKLSRLRYKT